MPCVSAHLNYIQSPPVAADTQVWKAGVSIRSRSRSSSHGPPPLPLADAAWLRTVAEQQVWGTHQRMPDIAWPRCLYLPGQEQVRQGAGDLHWPVADIQTKVDKCNHAVCMHACESGIEEGMRVS